MMNLKYHKRSLGLISQRPEFRAFIYPDLPASVAEWYSLVNSVDLIKQYSNVDFPLLPSEFRTYTYEDKELTVFMYDNAGILWYAFEDRSNEDPPVYVNVEPPPDRWVKHCESFSTFIYTWFFDHIHYVKKNLLIRKKGKPLHNDALQILRNEFVSEPMSHAKQGPTVYRFSLNDQRILVYNFENVSSHWLFTADTQASLNEVYEKFEHLL